MTKRQRPLSPHLQIYKPQLTSVMSIFHRMTGIALSLFLGVFVVWLYGLATNQKIYTFMTHHMQQWYGLLVVVGVLFSLWYHLLNGVRHLVWDMGKNLEIKSLYFSGYLTLFLTGCLTGITYLLLFV